MGVTPEPTGAERARVDEVILTKINVTRLARQTRKEEFIREQELLASHPPHLPPREQNFPKGFVSVSSNQYGAMGAMLIAMQSTGVFSEDYLVGNSQTKEGLNHGQLGQAMQQFFAQAAATPARIRPLAIDSNPISNKAEVAGKSAKPNKLSRRELNLPNAFMGNILDLLQHDQEGASEPSPLAKHFSTNTAKWTTCVNCTCTWIDPEPQRCHIKLTVPAAPTLGPHDAPHSRTCSANGRGESYGAGKSARCVISAAALRTCSSSRRSKTSCVSPLTDTHDNSARTRNRPQPPQHPSPCQCRTLTSASSFTRTSTTRRESSSSSCVRSYATTTGAARRVPPSDSRASQHTPNIPHAEDGSDTT